MGRSVASLLLCCRRHFGFSRSRLAAQHAAHVVPSIPQALLERSVPIRTGIGVAHDDAGTKSAEAQAFYDQGLAYLHSFVWIEAARSFHQALRARSESRARARRPQLRLHRAEQACPGEAGDCMSAQALAPKAGDHERRHIEARALQMAAEDAPRDQSRLAAYRKSLDAAIAAFPNDVELLLKRGMAESPDPADRGQGSVLASVPFYERALKPQGVCVAVPTRSICGASFHGARVREQRPHEGSRRCRGGVRVAGIEHPARAPHARTRAAAHRPHHGSHRAVRSGRQAAARLPGEGKDRAGIRLASRAQSRTAGGVVSVHRPDAAGGGVAEAGVRAAVQPAGAGGQQARVPGVSRRHAAASKRRWWPRRRSPRIRIRWRKPRATSRPASRCWP